MRELDARPVHRVKGRPALLRRLRGLLVAAHRFGRHRATSPAERLWAAHLVDCLTVTVATSDPGSMEVPEYPATGSGHADRTSDGRPVRAQGPPVQSGAGTAATSTAPSATRPLASPEPNHSDDRLGASTDEDGRRPTPWPPHKSAHSGADRQAAPGARIDDEYCSAEEPEAPNRVRVCAVREETRDA